MATVLSTLAAVAPGLNYVGEAKYSNTKYRPIIAEVHETYLHTKWSHVLADIQAGLPSQA